MKINELILFGFKSFPLETRIRYGQGITAIVGPNGTGKSNIIDSLRWILGEQSLRKLRCKRVEDLIFTSLDEKKNLGYTEVCLIIENEGRFPQYGEEIEIKRRFYRSGEGEFYINRAQCRLMDIQDLFLNSGALSYSFLERDEVKDIVSGDIREMFEDAAGIALYRERRDASQRKLQATQQDLLRLQDLLSEVERLVRSLRRQARRTQVYDELRNRIKKVGLSLLKKRLGESLDKLKEQQAVLDRLQREEHGVLDQMKSRETSLGELKKEIDVLTNQHDELINRLTDLKNAIAQGETLFENFEITKESLERELALKRMRIVSRQVEMDAIKEKIARRRADLEACRSEENAIKVSFQEDEDRISKAEAGVFRLRSSIDEKRRVLKEMDDAKHSRELFLSQKKADRANLEALRERIGGEMNVLQSSLEDLRRQKAAQDERLRTLGGQEKEINRTITESKGQLADITASIATNNREIEKRDRLLFDLRTEAESLKVRLRQFPVEKIKEIFGQRYDGCLYEDIKIEPGYEAAVNGALGEILNFHIVDRIGEQDLTGLKREQRVGFLLRGEASAAEAPADSLIKHVTLGRRAARLNNHLGNFIVAPDFAAAYRQSESAADHYFVTLDGAVIRDGLVVISGPPEDVASLTKRAFELAELIENMANEIAFLRQEGKRIEALHAEIELSLEKQKTDLTTVVVEISGLEIKVNNIVNQRERTQNQLASSRNEVRDIQDQVSEIEREVALGLGLDEKSFDAAGVDIITMEKELVRTESDYHDVMGKTSEIRSRLARVEEKINGLNREIEDQGHDVETGAREVETLELEIDQHQKELAGTKQALAKLYEDVAAQKAVVEKREKEFSVKGIESKVKTQGELLSALNELRDNLEVKREEILKARMAYFEIEQGIKQCHEQAQQEYSADPLTAVVEPIENPEERHTELLSRLDRLGPCNPLSVTEYEKEKKRLDDILTQRDDVVQAKTTLETSIKELDQEARASFLITFQQVREHFQRVFQNFFVGGEADLLLSDEVSPFESTIEIVARPMGKKLKHIHQLSTGEQTLLAISLMFAFYFVRPSPFCIIDEIDAPLDDANIVRFAEFLRDLSSRTQILLITHNKVTMEYADYIYGVTMEEPGASKIVSMRLRELTGALESP